MTMLACGHAANATDSEGNPCCVICVGIHAGATTIVASPDLAGRDARCTYFSTCRSQLPSNLKLAFFEFRPDRDFDEYYCGCKGWD